MVKSFFKTLPGVIIITVVSLALIVLLTYALVWAERPIIKIQRENIQQSQQYTESQVQRLDSLLTEWNRLETEKIKASDNQKLVDSLNGQQKALVSQMERIADLIPESEIPDDILTFLATH